MLYSHSAVAFAHILGVCTNIFLGLDDNIVRFILSDQYQLSRSI